MYAAVSTHLRCDEWEIDFNHNLYNMLLPDFNDDHEARKGKEGKTWFTGVSNLPRITLTNQPITNQLNLPFSSNRRHKVTRSINIVNKLISFDPKLLTSSACGSTSSINPPTVQQTVTGGFEDPEGKMNGNFEIGINGQKMIGGNDQRIAASNPYKRNFAKMAKCSKFVSNSAKLFNTWTMGKQVDWHHLMMRSSSEKNHTIISPGFGSFFVSISKSWRHVSWSFAAASQLPTCVQKSVASLEGTLPGSATAGENTSERPDS